MTKAFQSFDGKMQALNQHLQLMDVAVRELCKALDDAIVANTNVKQVQIKK